MGEMALNVVPLLFVALPFVLTMDAMYDLYQDFALPSDRRGWGYTDDTAKVNRVKRAHIKYFRGVLAHQAKSFAEWKKTEKGRSWSEKEKTRLKKLRERSTDKELPIQRRNEAADELRTDNTDLRQKYGYGVT